MSNLQLEDLAVQQADFMSGTNFDGDAISHFEYDILINHSLKEDMQPLTLEKILKEHYIGAVLLHNFVSGHGVPHSWVLAYAGITGSLQLAGNELAEIGGLLVHPMMRGKGLGSQVVKELITLADNPDFMEAHGFDGFSSKCNPQSLGLFQKLGFVIADEVDGKTIVTNIS